MISATVFLIAAILVLCIVSIILLKMICSLKEENEHLERRMNILLKSVDTSLASFRNSIQSIGGRVTTISKGLELQESKTNKFEDRIHTLEVKSDVTAYKY